MDAKETFTVNVTRLIQDTSYKSFKDKLPHKRYSNQISGLISGKIFTYQFGQILTFFLF